MFQFNQALNREVGCPLTRYESVSKGDGPQPFFSAASDIEFVRDSLTSIELKVFAAWEKNARNNPVN